MKDGVLQQIDSPADVYSKPANLFTALFIGSPPMNTWDGEVVRGENGALISFGGLSIPAEGAGIPDAAYDRPLTIGLRPEYVKAGTGAGAEVTMRVDGIENMGRENIVYLTRPGVPGLCMAAGADFGAGLGDRIPVRLQTEHLRFFCRDSGEAVM